ncbi:MAG: hypothetical protein WC678_00565 [Parcubacteria group bacterium]|jgi:hypothetical protein
MLAFVEFNFRPDTKEKIIIELITLHSKIEEGKAQFEDIGNDLNSHIYYFNEMRDELLPSLSSQEKRLLPKEIEEINLNCL